MFGVYQESISRRRAIEREMILSAGFIGQPEAVTWVARPGARLRSDEFLALIRIDVVRDSHFKLKDFDEVEGILHSLAASTTQRRGGPGLHEQDAAFRQGVKANVRLVHVPGQ